MPATIARHIAWAATIVSAAATLTTLSSTIAAADLEGPDIVVCTNGFCVTPASYVVGQSYTFRPFIDGGNNDTPPTYSFYDNGACLGNDATRSITWIPQTAGVHTMSTSARGTTNATFTVTVVAAPAGSPIPPQPAQGGCGGGGSIGSGSGGFGS